MKESGDGQSGVTFLELLVTLAIIMVLASVAMPLSKVSAKRAREIELRQELRMVRAAIDAFKFDWNRDGDLLFGALCVKNKLTCKEAASVSGYPKTVADREGRLAVAVLYGSPGCVVLVRGGCV